MHFGIRRRDSLIGITAATLMLAVSAQPLAAQQQPPAAAPSESEAATQDQDSHAAKDRRKGAPWQPIPISDESLWEPCQFGGDGDVVIGNDRIHLGVGDPLTGVLCKAEVPRENFELELEARRVSGFDFFCGLTFPVGEGQCSLILGGWAGGIAGLSSIDGRDASENATKRLMRFDNDRWYRVRVRVDDRAVQAWVDDKQIVDQPREGHEFDIRVELFPSLPLGVAAFQCESELRNFRWRKVADGK